MDENREERFYDLLEADENDAEAQYQIGLCYLNGDGTDKDTQKAETYFRRASELGHAAAAEMLGKGSEDEGQPRLSGMNIADLCLMAEEGNKDAQYEAAKYFLEHDNKTEAQRYMNMAAQQGHALACYELAKTMLPIPLHDGCGQDGEQLTYQRAVSMLKNAVDCSCAPAAELLAECYAYGIGMDPDLKQATKYFETAVQFAAPEEKAEKMFQMAVRCLKGDHVAKSVGKAFSWLRKAELAGMTDARAKFDEEYAQYQQEEDRRAAQEATHAEYQRQQEAIAAEQEAQEKKRLEEVVRKGNEFNYTSSPLFSYGSNRYAQQTNPYKDTQSKPKREKGNIFKEILSVITAIFGGIFGVIGGIFHLFPEGDSRDNSGCGCAFGLLIIVLIIVFLFQSIGGYLATFIQHAFG